MKTLKLKTAQWTSHPFFKAYVIAWLLKLLIVILIFN